MPIVTVPGVGDIDFPDRMSQEEIVHAIENEILPNYKPPSAPPPEAQPETGIFAAAKKGLMNLASSSLQYGESLFGNPNVAALKAMQRSSEIDKQYADQTDFKKIQQAYQSQPGLLGIAAAGAEFASQSPYAIAENAPFIASMWGGAKLGALAGAPLGPAGSATGATIGGLIGMALPSYLSQAGDDLKRQAEVQQQQGKPIDVSVAKASLAAIPQAALDLVEQRLLFGSKIVGKLIGRPVEKALQTEIVEGEKIANERVAASIAKGFGKGLLAEIPTENAQQIIERFQAGLPLLTPDAISEYGNTTYQVALLSPLGVFGRFAEKHIAKQELPGLYSKLRGDQFDQSVAQRQKEFIDAGQTPQDALKAATDEVVAKTPVGAPIPVYGAVGERKEAFYAGEIDGKPSIRLEPDSKQTLPLGGFFDTISPQNPLYTTAEGIPVGNLTPEQLDTGIAKLQGEIKQAIEEKPNATIMEIVQGKRRDLAALVAQRARLQPEQKTTPATPIVTGQQPDQTTLDVLQKGAAPEPELTAAELPEGTILKRSVTAQPTVQEAANARPETQPSAPAPAKKEAQTNQTLAKALGTTPEGFLVDLAKRHESEEFQRMYPIIRQRIDTSLKNLGLTNYLKPAELTPRIPAEEGVNVNGVYENLMIKLALSGRNSMQIMAGLNHEAIHAMKGLGMITNAEWAALSKVAQEKWIPLFRVTERYTDLSPEQQVEEAVADAFATYSTGRSPVITYALNPDGTRSAPQYVTKDQLGLMGRNRGIWNRIASILGVYGKHMRDAGFDDVEKIFQRIQTQPAEIAQGERADETQAIQNAQPETAQPGEPSTSAAVEPAAKPDENRVQPSGEGTEGAVQKEGVSQEKFSLARIVGNAPMESWTVVPDNEFYRQHPNELSLGTYMGKPIYLPVGSQQKEYGALHILDNAARDSNRGFEKVSDSEGGDMVRNILSILGAKDLRAYSDVGDATILQSNAHARALVLHEKDDGYSITTVRPAEASQVARLYGTRQINPGQKVTAPDGTTPLRVEALQAVPLVRSIRFKSEAERVKEREQFKERAAAAAAAKKPATVIVKKKRALGPKESRAIDVTQTPEFKKWFADSVVKDANGRPIPMYHGTFYDFNIFRTNSELGAHFGTAQQAQDRLNGMSNLRVGNQNLMPLYLRIQNPVRLHDVGEFSPISIVPQLMAQQIVTPYEARQLMYGSSMGLQRTLKAKGYDGAVYLNRMEGYGGIASVWADNQLNPNMSDEDWARLHPAAADSYIAFDPGQAKSAIGNRGMFDLRNPDIRYSRAPELPPPSGGELMPRPIFYSELGNRVFSAKMNAAPPAQWKAFINGLVSKGVKKEEISLSGIIDWLDIQENRRKHGLWLYVDPNGEAERAGDDVAKSDWEQAGVEPGYQIVKGDPRITKDEIAAILEQNKLQLDTKILGEPIAPAVAAQMLPEGYHIRRHNGRISLYDEDGNRINVYGAFSTEQEAIAAANADAYDRAHQITEEAVQNLAERMWQEQLPEEARNAMEDSDYLHFDINFVVPNVRVVKLPPDMLRPYHEFGIERISYAQENIEDRDIDTVAEFEERYPNGPRSGGFFEETFDSEEQAEFALRRDAERPADRRRFDVDGEAARYESPAFTVQFYEDDDIAGSFDDKSDAQTAAEEMADQRLQWEINAYMESASINDHGEYWFDRAREQLEEEHENNPVFQVPQPRTVPVRHQGSWQSDGGRDYREFVMFVHNIEPYNETDSLHFQTDTEGRTIVWIRAKIHDDYRGTPTMWIEEIQSQRGQAGDKHGFRKPGQEQRVMALQQAVNELRDKLKDKLDAVDPPNDHRGLMVRLHDLQYDAANHDAHSIEILEKINAELSAYESAKAELNTETDRLYNAIPTAPFVEDIHAWTALPIKYLLRYAVDHGISQMAWTTGEEQVVRYGTWLRKQVDRIAWKKDGDMIEIIASKNGNVFSQQTLNAVGLRASIGNTMAQQILQSPEQEGAITGNNIRIDKLGMYNYYGNEDGLNAAGKDSIVKSVFNKIVMPLGSKGVQPMFLRITEQGKTFPQAQGVVINPEMEGKIRDGLPQFSRAIATSYNTGLPIQGIWQSPELKFMDKLIFSLVNRYTDLETIQGEIEKVTGPILGPAADSDRFKATLKESLYHNRVAARIAQFLREDFKPLAAKMEKLGVTQTELQDFLLAQHAEERNDQIAKINPLDFPDGGSGMMTAKARAYLAGLPAAKRNDLNSVWQDINRILEGTRNLMVSGGLEKQSTINVWKKQYPHYVPLNRKDLEAGSGTGMGYDIRGEEVRRALGSSMDVKDILANIVIQRERTIIRSEKNRIDQAVLGLALKAPNPDFWLVIDPQAAKQPQQARNALLAMGLTAQDLDNIANTPTVRRLDEATGLVVNTPHHAFGKLESVMHVKVNGEEKYIWFNPNDERSDRLLRTMKNLDAQQLGLVLGTVAQVTRYFAAVNTQYNPVFGVVNLTRDTGSVLLNLTNTPLAGKQLKVMKEIPAALAGVWSQLRAERQGANSGTPMAKLYKKFSDLGGPTGFREMYATSEDRYKAIANEFKSLSDGPIKKSYKWIGNLLTDYNTTLENATRLAVFKVAQDSGISDDQSAMLGKTITVNFNRKGDMALQTGALYAFFNASVQGAAKLAETLTGPGGKKIIVGGLLLGALQALMMRQAGFDDDQPQEFIKAKSIVIPTGSGKYFTIPMPLGFNIIPNIGRLATEWYLGGFKKTSDKVYALFSSMMDSLSPVGSGTPLQSAAPTILDPVAALSENKDAFGRRIFKEDVTGLKPTPGYTRARDSSTPWSKWIAEYLNYAGGGTKYTPAKFMPIIMSPTPDQIDFLIGQITGGVGREISKAFQTEEHFRTGEDLPTYKIPLVSRFYGDTQELSAQSQKFYDNITRINLLGEERDGLRKDISLTPAERQRRLTELMKDPEASLIQAARSFEYNIQKLNEQKTEAQKRGIPPDTTPQEAAQLAAFQKQRIEQLDTIKKQRMAQFNLLVKNKQKQAEAVQ